MKGKITQVYAGLFAVFVFIFLGVKYNYLGTLPLWAVVLEILFMAVVLAVLMLPSYILHKSTGCDVFNVFLNKSSLTKIIFSSLKAQYKDMNEELFNEIQERIIERYIRLMAWEEIEKISTLNFHVRMRECDLLKLYQYYIFDRSRQRLIVNAKPYDNDQLYVNILGNRINLNDILIGDHYKWNPEKFPKIYDGSFKDFLESFDFEANGICRVHDSIYASDENDILIGRKMKSVIDKLF